MSKEKSIIVEVIRFLNSFRTYEFRTLVVQKLGLEREKRASSLLTELIEDGIIERVAIGEYRVLRVVESQDGEGG